MVGIDALGFEKEKTFAPVYKFSVYSLKNKVSVVSRELHFEISPDTRLAVGGNKTDTNCKMY